MAEKKAPSGTIPVDQFYRNILVPTDGSIGAQLAVDHAVVIARAFDGKIHALSVDESAGSVQQDQLRTDTKEHAKTATEEAVQKAEANGVTVTIAVEEGTPEQTIIDYATQTDIDLIVMGTHAHTGIKNILFGSTAEEIVRNAFSDCRESRRVC